MIQLYGGWIALSLCTFGPHFSHIFSRSCSSLLILFHFHHIHFFFGVAATENWMFTSYNIFKATPPIPTTTTVIPQFSNYIHPTLHMCLGNKSRNSGNGNFLLHLCKLAHFIVIFFSYKLYEWYVRGIQCIWVRSAMIDNTVLYR